MKELQQLERLAASELRSRVDTAVRAVIETLNAGGHQFVQADPEDGAEWVEASTGTWLTLHCAMGVSVETGRRERVADPEVDEFIALAESGTDQRATLLNMLEGGIANGGLYQLHENKGTSFLSEAAAALHSVGARSKAKLVLQALQALDRDGEVLRDYAALRTTLQRLDARYERSRENVVALFKADLRGGAA